MAITLTNPQGVPQVDFHHQVSIATGSKIVFMAGQVAWGADGRLVGENDFTAQVERCYLNVAAALAGIGGSLDDIAKLTIYVVSWSMDKMPAVEEARARACAALGVETFAALGTLVGVAALYAPSSSSKWRRSRFLTDIATKSSDQQSQEDLHDVIATADRRRKDDVVQA